MIVPVISDPVRDAFAAWPDHISARASALRALIYQTAEATGAGQVHESLKWGQPSFSNGKAGTPLRLGYAENQDLPVRIYAHCATTFIDQCRARFPEFEFEGNRAICLSDKGDLPEDLLQSAIALALTYHSSKAMADG